MPTPCPSRRLQRRCSRITDHPGPHIHIPSDGGPWIWWDDPTNPAQQVDEDLRRRNAAAAFGFIESNPEP